MKTRDGFVSNSSTTSFLCDICHNIESGMDMSADDANFFVCNRGHEICQTHIEYIREDWEVYDDIPEEECPICQITEMAFSEWKLKFPKIDYESEIKDYKNSARTLFFSHLIEEVNRDKENSNTNV